MGIADAVRSWWRNVNADAAADLAAPARRAAPLAAGGLVSGGARAAPLWPAHDAEQQARRAFGVAVVAACVDAIARDASAAPLRVWRDTGDDFAVDAESAAARNARALVSAPNPAMGEPEFWYFVVAQAIVSGFCAVEKVRAANGRVVQLWPLVSPWLKVRPRDQALPDWEYRVPGHDPWPLRAEDVVVVQYRPAPDGSPTGRTPMRTVARELAIADQLAGFLFNVLQSGGLPVFGLKLVPQGEGREIPDVSEEDRDLIVESWKQKYGGVNAWPEPAWLGGVEPVKLGMDLDELLFPEVRDHIETAVCMSFGVPPGLIGTLAGLERNTFSNYEASVGHYYDGTIRPLWRSLGGAFDRGLMPEFDPSGALDFRFDASDIGALREDESPRWQRAQQGLGSGFVTMDEARAQVGLPPLPAGAGEVLLLPFSATVVRPADLAGMADETAAPPAPVPAALRPGGEEPAQEGDDDDDLPPPGERFVRRDVRAWDGPDFPLLLRGHYRAAPRTRTAIHTRSKKDIARLSSLGARRLRAFWRQQGERIAGQVTRSGPAPEARALDEVDWAAEEDALAQVLRRIYGLNMEAALDAVSATLGVDIDFDLSNPRLRSVMDRLAGRVTGINDTTRRQVAETVTSALEEGATVPQLTQRINDLFGGYRPRAEVLARTESQVSYNLSATEGYIESGLVGAAELLDNPDHGDYDGDGDGLTCAQRAGMVVPLEQVERHVFGTHPACILAVAPILSVPLGEG